MSAPAADADAELSPVVDTATDITLPAVFVKPNEVKWFDMVTEDITTTLVVAVEFEIEVKVFATGVRAEAVTSITVVEAVAVLPPGASYRVSVLNSEVPEQLTSKATCVGEEIVLFATHSPSIVPTCPGRQQKKVRILIPPAV